MQGVGDVIKIEGPFTGERYIDILENFLIPSLQLHFTDPALPLIYVQDRSPVHMARPVQDWLQEQSPVLQPLDLPSRGYMINTWNAGQERNLQQLMHHIERERENLRGTDAPLLHYLLECPATADLRNQDYEVTDNEANSAAARLVAATRLSRLAQLVQRRLPPARKAVLLLGPP